MNKSYPNLLFSAVVTAVMNGIDMTYHLATGWAVHLNYVAIKITIIFLTVWMITQFIGKGVEEGLVSSLFAPFIFYIYYVFAGATLNRAVFKIDEQFWFYFLHVACMLIAYFAAWYFVSSKKHGMRTISFVVAAAFLGVALDALYIMARWRLQGIDEETAAHWMMFSVIIIPLVGYLIGIVIVMLVVERMIQKRFFDGPLVGLVAGSIIGLATGSLLHGVAAFVIANLAYYMMHTYKKGFMEMSE